MGKYILGLSIIFLFPLNYLFDFFSILSHICLSAICLYLHLNPSLSFLPISTSLSLSLSSFLTSRQPSSTADLAIVSLALYMFLDFSLPLKFGWRKRKATKHTKREKPQSICYHPHPLWLDLFQNNWDDIWLVLIYSRSM